MREYTQQDDTTIMLKNIKFLDIELDGQVYSFQLHLFDYYERDSFNVRVHFVRGHNLTFFFSLLKWMLPNANGDNTNLFKQYLNSVTRDCCSRIMLDFYADVDVRSFEVGYRKQGISYEIADSYTRRVRGEYSDSLRIKDGEHIYFIRENMFVMDLSNKLEVDYAIMRTGEILSGFDDFPIEDFWTFLYQLYNESGYDVRDIQGTTIQYNDLHSSDINYEPDDVRYIYALSYMIYATFVKGGILVIDHAELLDASTLLHLYNIYKSGISNRAKPQLILCSDSNIISEQLCKYHSRLLPCATQEPLIEYPMPAQATHVTQIDTTQSAFQSLWNKYL